jgi:nucleoid DNA-binding protein
MKRLKIQLETGDNVYLRGFEVIIKTRAEKTGRNISKIPQ